MRALSTRRRPNGNKNPYPPSRLGSPLLFRYVHDNHDNHDNHVFIPNHLCFYEFDNDFNLFFAETEEENTYMGTNRVGEVDWLA